MSKYEKMVDEIKQIIKEKEPDYDGSGTRFMGYRPSEERIKQVLKEIIDEHKIVKIELDINREWISYWYQSSTPNQSHNQEKSIMI